MVDSSGNPIVQAARKAKSGRQETKHTGESESSCEGKPRQRVKKYDADGNVYYDFATPERGNARKSKHSDTASVDSKGRPVLRDSHGKRLPPLPQGS